ncbi:hypothetical protein K2173_012163 [Erythroxylum novogranatense]|uniref:DUF7148 domain-containing protein n=1 Tax=Erythroxylum novogranatense TaxID=1862640 RepID=A0AAV8SS04_9ROSI|nr:hypothetical protein K2173_012163 [Erythroxylum novogranatense]
MATSTIRTIKQLQLLYFYPTLGTSELRPTSSSLPVVSSSLVRSKPRHFYSHQMYPTVVAKSSSQNDAIVSADDQKDGVSLGTMKLPVDTDLQRFESLLFQWANSLCQGANLPLPVPLKVDKIPGGARLGFITIGEGQTEVLVYIDCVVFPASGDSAPMFRAIRNGPLKDEPPPGEARIMRSLLQALKKSVEITTA